MLSQIRSTRYAAMAMAIVTGLMCAAPSGSDAAPFTATFEITVVCDTQTMPRCPTGIPDNTETGKLTGSFTGEDTDGDKIIDAGELTALTVTWTPGTFITDPGPPPLGIVFSPAMFTRMLSDFANPGFIEFMYTTPDFMDTLENKKNTIIQLNLGDSTTAAAGHACEDSSNVLAQCILGQFLHIFPPAENAFLYRISQAIVTPGDTAVIPEPGTWLLLGTGLVGVLGCACYRRLRPATLRRDSHTDV